MDKQLKHGKDDYLIKCFRASLLTGVLSFAYFIICGGGTFTLIDDFNVQQLTFPAAIQTALKEQSIGEWCWNLDLGCSLINGFSFYNLGSPFFWVSFLFPKTWFPYIVGELYILKYVVASLTAYLYLRRFAQDKSAAVIGALLYSFSGFQAENLLFYHFHDVVALFPLLPLALERLADKEPRGGAFFAFAVFVNCALNYYFFVMEVVFLILYFIFRYAGNPLKLFASLALRCIALGALGIGMAAVLFLPNIIYILGNSRSAAGLTRQLLLTSSKEILYILKGMLLPGEAMNGESAILTSRFSSTCCYLPLAGMSLAAAYVFKNRKSWLSWLLVALLLISFSPLLQSAFIVFTEVNQRWWFMLTLMLSLASVKALDSEWKRSTGKYMAAIYSAGVIIYALVVYFVPQSFGAGRESLIFNDKRYWTLVAIAAAGPALLALLLGRKSFSYRAVLAAVMAFSVVTTGLDLSCYREGADSEYILSRYSLGAKLPVLNEQYRYNETDNLLTLTGKAAGIGCFSSTIENSSRAFSTLFDNYSSVFTTDKSALGLPQLLAGKYSVSSEPGSDVVAEIDSDGARYYISESEACPIGFSVSNYITREALLSLDRDERAIALMNAVAVDEEDISLVSGNAEELRPELLNYESGLSGYVSQCVKNGVVNFSRNSSGFSCEADYELPSLVFFSVPYDSGWTALIDGEEADVIDSCGMMALSVPAGKHSVEFIYSTPGLRAGAIVSALSWSAFTAYLVFRRRGKGAPASV